MSYGGNGGSTFSTRFDSTTFGARNIIIRHSTGIDNIQLCFGDGVDTSCTLAYGGTGGVLYNWVIP